MGGGAVESAVWSPEGTVSAADTRHTTRSRHVVVAALCSVMVCLGVATWLTVDDIVPPSAQVVIGNSLRVVSATLFVGAGVLRISRWRVAREPRSALLGTALVVFGSLTFPLSNIAAALQSEPASALSPMTRATTTLVTLGLVMVAMHTRRAKDQIRPGLLTAAALLVTLVCFGALMAAAAFLDLDLGPAQRTQFLLELTLAISWLLAAVSAYLAGPEQPWAYRVTPLLAAMGVAEGLRAVAVYDLFPWEMGAAALATAVSAIALYSAMGDLSDATDQETRRLDAVQGALAQAEEVLSAHDAWREELTHDARNAIAGLRAALTTLQRYEEKLDPAAAQRLRFAVLGEVGHLEHLIIRSNDDDCVGFAVDDVVCAAVESRRAAGHAVRLESFSCTAWGRPGDLATALQNLLVNAEVHAGGKSVAVRVRPCGDWVEVRVEDRGPGIAQSQRDGLFDRGQLGESSPGSGLGLYVARTLMRQQGGDLYLAHDDTDGTVFVLTMPTAVEPASDAKAPWIPTQPDRSGRRPAGFPAEAR